VHKLKNAALLAALMILGSTIALSDYIKSGGERVLDSPNSGQQFIFRTNVGGTPTNVLVLDTDQQVMAQSLGSVSMPAFSFATDQDTGLISNGNNVGLIAGGVERAQIASSGIRLTGGTVSNPAVSFIDDNDTGFYNASANTVRLSGGGVDRWSWGSSVNTYISALQGPDGSAAAPAFSFSTDPDVGVYRPAGNNLGFATAGVLRATLTTSSLNLASGVNLSLAGGTVTQTGTGGNTPHECRIQSASTTAATITASCTLGDEILTGGGCRDHGTTESIRASYPSTLGPSPAGVWSCVRTGSGDTLTAYAICCDY
jgi:hypothetical protein